MPRPEDLARENIDAALRSDKPEVRRLLGTEGGYGEELGLARDWGARIVRHVGNYAEVYDRNVGVGSNPVPKNTGRLPFNAAAGVLRWPSRIVACGGLRMTPVTVLRRLTISACSCGAEVP